MTRLQTHADYRLSHLDELESESIHVFREVAAEFERPVLMFSGGKDSIVMLRLADKVFHPGRLPFPLLQIDTGLDFPEVLETRDRWVERLGVRLLVDLVRGVAPAARPERIPVELVVRGSVAGPRAKMEAAPAR